MTEHEPRPATETGQPDWRRLDVVHTRFAQRIADGISEASEAHREIDGDTARCIAHVLGRAVGRSSRLADFGRTGEGTYLELRDEYLKLYGSEQASPETKELINWLGTYLVEQENTGSGRRFMNEHLPPTLDLLLVRTEVTVNGQLFVIHLPASLDGTQIEGIREELALLQLDKDEALQAFLSLPDVDANTPMLMESFEDAFVRTFPSMEDAVHGLCELDEWEREVSEFASERGLYADNYSVDYEMLTERLGEIYDLVRWKERIHVFNK